MPSDELLSSALLKIKRAEHHINDLNRQINAFLAERPFKLFYFMRPKAGEGTIGTKTEKSIPEEFAMIIGDAAHNLRSALDHAMFALCSKSESPWLVEFPFSREPERMEAAIKKGQVWCAGEKVVEAVRKLQPHGCGNPILWGLASLNNRDKHRLPVVTWRTAELTAPQLQQLGFTQIRGPGSLIFSGEASSDHILMKDVKFDGSRADRRRAPDYEQEAHVQPTYSIWFAEGQPFENEAVISALYRATRGVERAIREIAEAYLSQG